MLAPHPTPYLELNAVLQDLVSSTQSMLPDDFVGVYLQGSFAVGDFDRHSDCDFIVVVNQEPSDSQLCSLQAMHERISDLEYEWARHLEGSYFSSGVLRDHTQSGTELWYVDKGSRVLVKSRHDNTVVVRWIVREKGVALAGPPPSALIDPIPTDVLRREILATFADWGEQILAEPQQINSRFYQTFAVLSYCRMLHDLHTGVIGSKRSGAEWAKQHVDPSWADLIDRAWDGRPDPVLSSREPADPADLASTLEFVKEVLWAAKEYAATLQLT